MYRLPGKTAKTSVIDFGVDDKFVNESYGYATV